MSRPQDWFVVIGVLVLYFALALLLPDPLWQVFASFYLPVSCLLVGLHIQKLSKSPDQSLSDAEKTKMLVLLPLNIIISQALYYFVLKKSKPAIASTAARLGWKVFAVWIVFAVIFVALYSMNSWEAQYNEIVTKLRQDGATVQAASNNNDKDGLIQACRSIGEHSSEIQKLPDYPEEKIQAQIVDGGSKIGAGAAKCVTSVTNEDVVLAKEAFEEMSAGLRLLNSAADAANAK